MSKSYRKKGPLCDRRGKPGKSVSEQVLEFGEVVQLPGGVPTSRVFDQMYKQGAPDPQGGPLPRGSLYDR